jgi:hypothetical protein
VGPLLFAATGVHATLLALLYREQLVCRPCVGTAVAASLAAAAWAVAHPQLVAALAFPAGLIFAWETMRRAHAAFLARAETNGSRLAQAVASEAAPPSGRARVVVYKRPRCPACAYYEAIVRPALDDEFGERIDIDEREAGRQSIITPLVVVRGAALARTFLGLDPDRGDYEEVRAAVEAALDVNGSKQPGGGTP